MMNKTSLLALALIGLFLNSCANTPIKAADENFESLGISAFRSNDRVITLPDSDRTPANQNLPRWELSGLGNDYSNTGKPEQKCLQTYIETVAKPFIKTGKPDPSLAKWILDLSAAMKLDPYIFAGLIRQESGNFLPVRNVNGVGLTQITNIAIDDACYALTGTDCKEPLANPKHTETWEKLYEDGVRTLYGTDDFRAYYVWNLACTNFKPECVMGTPKRRGCGFATAGNCGPNMRTKIFEDIRLSLLMGAFTLSNKLAEAKAILIGSKKNTSTLSIYRKGLELYNAHDDHKDTYPGNILDKHVVAIKKACPPEAVNPVAN